MYWNNKTNVKGSIRLHITRALAFYLAPSAMLTRLKLLPTKRVPIPPLHNGNSHWHREEWKPARLSTFYLKCLASSDTMLSLYFCSYPIIPARLETWPSPTKAQVPLKFIPQTLLLSTRSPSETNTECIIMKSIFLPATTAVSVRSNFTLSQLHPSLLFHPIAKSY